MIIPIHLLFTLSITFLLYSSGIMNVNIYDFLLVVSAELIDLDHFLSGCIYNPRRSSFRTCPLHKRWKLLSLVALVMLFFRPVMFLGFGILSHFLLDYVDTRMIRKVK